MKICSIVTLVVFVCLISSPVCAKKDKLPYGLQKKVAKGEPLPPGWQKKLARGKILDMDIYRHKQVVVPLDSHGLITVRIEGKLVRLHEATREIIDILK
jgi:hypothetical protein